MTCWGRARDAVLAGVNRLGRRVALAIVEALQRKQAHDEFLVVHGSWRAVLEVLGVEACGKAALAALKWLAELDDVQGRVVRLTSHTWRVCVAGGDALLREQLEMELGMGAKGKAESSGKAAVAAPAKRHRDSHACARAAQLERVAAPKPRHNAARAIVDHVERTGARVTGRVFEVTLTRGAEPIEQAAQKFAAEYEVALVPELSPCGMLHFHGFVVGSNLQARHPGVFAHELERRWQDCGGGVCSVRQVLRKDRARLRHWAGYSFKGEDKKTKRVGSGDIGEVLHGRKPTIGGRPVQVAEESVRGRVARAAKWLRDAWRKWGLGG